MTTGAIGEILAGLRREKGIGQKELADHLRLSVGTISNYENNVHSPDLETLCKIADYFGVTTDYILGRTTCRRDPEILNRRISRDYTVTDIINTVLNFDSSTVDHLMEYIYFLQSRR